MSKLINLKGKIIDLENIENTAFKRVLEKRAKNSNFLFFYNDHKHVDHIDHREYDYWEYGSEGHGDTYHTDTLR